VPPKPRSRATPGEFSPARAAVGLLRLETLSLAVAAGQWEWRRKKLARYPINGRHCSLREIAAELEAAGHVTSKGTPYGAAAIARMIA
jgi:hypothetical protein